MRFIPYPDSAFFTTFTLSPNLRIRLRAQRAFSGLVAAACCLVAAACTKGSSPTAPSGPPAPGSAIRYTALGASDAIGYGSSSPCLPYTECPGNGYVYVATRQLRAQGYTVTLTDIGIPTAVISPAFQSLAQQYGLTVVGNFIDGELPFVPQSSTLVTIFAGANDVNVITAALGGGAGGSNPAGFIDQQVLAFGNGYQTLVNGLRSGTSSARLVVLNLPNLAGLPYLAGATLLQREAAQRASVEMTTSVINPLRAANLAVIDLMCDPRLYQPSIYSSDGFHPNDAGYAILAADVVQATTSSSYPAPQASCAQMSLVP
jgi:lysophospholipase L1-like esterase